jgi:hypothetical protein
MDQIEHFNIDLCGQEKDYIFTISSLLLKDYTDISKIIVKKRFHWT